LTVDLVVQAVQVAEMSEELLIADVERRLTSTYADMSPNQISDAIRNARASFENSRLQDFVPLLVELTRPRRDRPTAGTHRRFW
jgi:hypothetical protein